MEKNIVFIPSEEEVLRYGKYLVDEEFYEEGCIEAHNTKIRVIKYINDLYFHKMIDGDCVEFRRLG